MKEKIKEIVKKDGVYFLVAFGLLIATLLITTTIYHGEDFSLQIPKSTLFGTISWIEILVVGLPSIFLLRNIDRNKTKLEKIYLCLVIPLGILYCLTNGFLDSIPVADLRRFEEQLYLDLKVDEEGKKLAGYIQSTKSLPELDKLNAYLTDFKKRFE